MRLTQNKSKEARPKIFGRAFFFARRQSSSAVRNDKRREILFVFFTQSTARPFRYFHKPPFKLLKFSAMYTVANFEGLKTLFLC